VKVPEIDDWVVTADLGTQVWLSITSRPAQRCCGLDSDPRPPGMRCEGPRLRAFLLTPNHQE